jgi:drug/metabolite transporter (DMT)-like permease
MGNMRSLRPHNGPVRTVLVLAVAVLAVSLSGPLMAAMVVPPLALAFWRNAMATAALAPVVVTRRRSELRALDGPQARLLGAAGVALAVHFAGWVTALTLTSVASATAIVCLQIAWVALWELAGGARYGAGMVVGLAVAFTGVLVVSGVDLALSREALLGDLLALVGGIAAAAYMILGARVRASTSTTTYTFVCYGACAAVLAVACLVAGQPLAGYATGQWVLLLVVTLTAQLLGHSLLNHAVADVGPMVISLVLLLEVPGAALLAAVIVQQRPPPGAVLGMVLVLAGMALVILRQRGGGPGAGTVPVD